MQDFIIEAFKSNEIFVLVANDLLNDREFISSLYAILLHWY